jgi:DNA-binding transcriptional regulator YdaS (Cro superfamily)
LSKTSADAIKKAVEIVGGKQQLAKIVGVTYKTILDWTSGRSGITLYNALKIEKATKGQITAKEILPSFPWDDLK